MLDIKKRILSLIPASWWTWRIWRFINPVHVAVGVPYAAVFRDCGWESVAGQLGFVGVVHEITDGDFDKSKTPTAPWEGIKDTYSFVIGGLIYYLIRYAIGHV